MNQWEPCSHEDASCCFSAQQVYHKIDHQLGAVLELVCAGANILGDASAIQAELCGASVAIRRATAFVSGTLTAEDVLRGSEPLVRQDVR